jgi:glucan biosynthesis protein C
LAPRDSHLPGSDLTSRAPRLYYIDWLRVLAMLSIFFFHNDRFFDFDDWHVKNNVTSVLSSIHIGFFNYWMMPLFFILSGASVYYSLRSRKPSEFIKERATRILVPLLFVGYFIIAPPEIYLDRLTHLRFVGTFCQFYPQYFQGFDLFGGNFAWHGVHLWYLLYLFLFSLILLPLFLPGKKSGNSLISRLTTLFEEPWVFGLLFLPLFAADVITDALGLGFSRATGGWSFFSYIVFFIYGYLIFSNTHIQDTVRRHCKAALMVALVLSLCGLIVDFLLKPSHSLGVPFYMSGMLVRALRSFCWIIAILGFGSRFLNFNNKFLGYANEAVLPFYILHQTIILIIGFYIVQWDMGVGAKYGMITSISFVAIMGIYELFIRRVNVLRFLFGMRLVKHES